MKNIYKPLFALLLLLFTGLSLNAQSVATESQKRRYKAVQGLGYLHTQVAILITNWDNHPLNTSPLDEFEEEWKAHILDELEHDEEWADYMLVEDNTVFSPEDEIDFETEEAIDANLKFYKEVISSLKTPELFEASLAEWKDELSAAEARLFDIIYPELFD